MSLTPSNMLPLGTSVPFFDLPLVPGTNLKEPYQNLKTVNSLTFTKRPLLFMVLCAHCPFVKHVEEELTRIYENYGNRIVFLAVASNSLITHPQDGPVQLAAQANKRRWGFPYLLDANQSLAKALKAACTPDFFLFDSLDGEHQTLQYRGQLDSSRPGNNFQVNGKDLRLAIDALLSGKNVCTDQKPSIGCNIKWHPGQEPPWFV